MRQKLYVRVSLAEDGKSPIREIMVDGQKVGEISYVEVIEALMQMASSLRFEVKR